MPALCIYFIIQKELYVHAFTISFSVLEFEIWKENHTIK